MRNPGLSPHTPHYILVPIRHTWVAASLHAGTQGAGHYWPRKIPGAAQEHPGVARKSSWLDLGILANMATSSQEQPRKFQEQPKSTQEWPGEPPGWIWASCTLAGPPGDGQPGVAQEAPGAAPRVPRSCQDELLAGFEHPWPTWLRVVSQKRVSRGGLYLYNTLTCVGRKGDA